ncbi:MAG TPA: peptidylprolyl isomerase [Polyangia bacterium]|nr:peptidylprolyl isomerase [Polyangia bacterium]
MSRLWREPTLHFFLLAAALLLGHRLVAGNPRTIVITPALKADLLRRYGDQLNRPLTSAEAEACMTAWKGDEALYREALREGIDRDDPTVRSVLIAKMRERVMLRTRPAEPTESDLQQYLAQHRDQFEAPLMYEHQFVVFPKSDPQAAHKRTQDERRLSAGATTASLGLRSTAANVTRDRIEQEFGPEVAGQICRLPIGQWHELETSDRLLLVKMDGIQGGLPPPDLLHARLLAAWQGEMQQKAMAQATRRIADRYRFEEPSR